MLERSRLNESQMDVNPVHGTQPMVAAASQASASASLSFQQNEDFTNMMDLLPSTPAPAAASAEDSININISLTNGAHNNNAAIGSTPTSTSTSMLLTPNTNASMVSSAASTSTSNTNHTNMNRSVLSDTTELTASNFVLAEKSRMMQFQALAKEQRELREATQRAKEQREARESKDAQNKALELEGEDPDHDTHVHSSARDETADSMDFGALLGDSVITDHIPIPDNSSAVNHNTSGLSIENDINDDINDDQVQEQEQGDDTIDTAVMDGILNFDDSIEDLRDESATGDMSFMQRGRRSSGASVSASARSADSNNEDEALLGDNSNDVNNTRLSTIRTVEERAKERNDNGNDEEGEQMEEAEEVATTQDHHNVHETNHDAEGLTIEPENEMELSVRHANSASKPRTTVRRRSGIHERQRSETSASAQDQENVDDKDNDDEIESDNVTDANTTKEAFNVSMSTSMNQSMVRQSRNSFGSSPFIRMNIPVSSQRASRRHSRNLNEQGQGHGGKGNLYRQSAQSVRKLTASIQKAKRRRMLGRTSISSSGRLQSPGFPVFHTMDRTNTTIDPNHEKEKGVEEDTEVQHVDNGECISPPAATDTGDLDPTTNHASDPNATFVDGADQINDLLGDLVANNNNDGDNNHDHNLDLMESSSAKIEKLDFSAGKDGDEMTPSSPAQVNIYTSAALSSVMKRSDYSRIYVPSPARSTRSKKRISSDNAGELLSLPESKKSDRKTTPRKAWLFRNGGSSEKRESARKVSSRRLSLDSTASDHISEGMDNTEMLMDYLVPNHAGGKGREDSLNKENDFDMDEQIVGPLLSQETGTSEASTLLLSSDSHQSEKSSASRNLAPEGSRQNISKSISSPATASSNHDEDLIASVHHSPLAHEAVDPAKKIKFILDNTNDDGSLGLRSLENKNHSSPSEIQSKMPSTNNENTSIMSTDTNELLGKSFGYNRRAKNATSKSPVAPPSSTKSKKIPISSHLSSDEVENEDGSEMLSLDSPASNSSSDMSYQTKGSDGITADTAALRDIMKDLTDDFRKPAKNHDMEDRRRSSIFAFTSLAQNGNDETTNSICRIEVDTADTQDLKGLLRFSDLDTRGSSLLPINEKEDSQEIEVPPDKNSGGDSMNSPGLLGTSAIAYTPKSILKRKKASESTPKRNVVFYPPVAAEYNIGSPASNFTPMCAKVTKTLFTIPRKEGKKQSVSPNEKIYDSMDTHSAEEDKGMTGSSVDSYIDQDDDSSPAAFSTEEILPRKSIEDATVSLENDLGTMIDKVSGLREELPEKVVNSNDETRNLSLRDTSMLRIMDGEIETVGLEGDLQRLLEKYNEKKNGYASPIQLSSDSTDRSAVEDKQSLKGTPNLYDDESDDSGGQGENTVSLETGMIDVIKNLQGNNKDTTSSLNIADDTGTLSLRNMSIEKSMNGETIALDKDLMGVLGQVDQHLNIAGNDSQSSPLSNISTTLSADGETIALDKDLRGVLHQIAQNATIDEGYRLSNTSNLSPRLDASVNESAMELESGTQEMLKHIADMSQLSEVEVQNDDASFTSNGGICSSDVIHNSDTADLESGLRDLIGKVDPELSRNMCTRSRDEDTLSLEDVSILQKSEGDTVGLENDLKALMNGGGAIGDEEKITHSSGIIQNENATNNIDDRFSPCSDATNGLREQSVSYQSSVMEIGCHAVHKHFHSPTVSSINTSNTSHIIRSIERVVGEDSNHGTSEASSSIGSMPSGSTAAPNRRSSRRFSLVPSGEISFAPSDLLQGSFIENSSSDNGVIHSSSHDEINADFLRDEYKVDMRWDEFTPFIPHLADETLLNSITSLLLSGSGAMMAEFNHPLVIEKIREFLNGVCYEIESNCNEDVDQSATITQCIDGKQTMGLHKIQQALRGEINHRAMATHVSEIISLDEAIAVTAKEDFTIWEVQVMGALGNTVQQMKLEVEDDLQQVDRNLIISNEIQSSLATISRRLVKKVQAENIQKKKVSRENFDTLS